MMETLEAVRESIDDPEFTSQRFHACQAKDCGVWSYYFAEVNGAVLSYCGHHATKYEVGLLAASQGNVKDFRHAILPTPS